MQIGTEPCSAARKATRNHGFREEIQFEPVEVFQSENQGIGVNFRGFTIGTPCFGNPGGHYRNGRHSLHFLKEMVARFVKWKYVCGKSFLYKAQRFDDHFCRDLQGAEAVGSTRISWGHDLANLLRLVDLDLRFIIS